MPPSTAAPPLVSKNSALTNSAEFPLVSRIDDLHSRGNAFADEARAVYKELVSNDLEQIMKAPLPQFVQPWLFGLFVPPPVWDPATRKNKRITLTGCLRYSAALLSVLVVLGGGLTVLALGIVLMLIPLIPLLTVLSPLLLLAGGAIYVYRTAGPAASAAGRPMAKPKFSSELLVAHAMREAQDVLSRVDCTSDAGASSRRSTFARGLTSRIPDRLASRIPDGLASRLPGGISRSRSFNEHVREATSLAVYGCGILASVHVGGLRALEQRGLQYDNIHTLAGVSAGSVVVALLAVGFTADSLLQTVLCMPFHQLPYPELGAILRATGNLTITLLKKLVTGGATPRRLRQLTAAAHETFEGNGPGVNSGAVLEQLIGEALEGAPGADRARARGIAMRDITLGEVLEVFGKRLVLIVTELDTGRERRLTPDVINGRTDKDLPVRIAVRMSMGVPGLFEPFRYQGHVYVDGGMCNDFPMNCEFRSGFQPARLACTTLRPEAIWIPQMQPAKEYS